MLLSHPKEEAQSAAHGTEKSKLLQSSVPIKGPGPGKQQHRDDRGKRTIWRPLSKGKSCSGEAHRSRKEEALQRARVQSSRSCYHGQWYKILNSQWKKSAWSRGWHFSSARRKQTWRSDGRSTHHIWISNHPTQSGRSLVKEAYHVSSENIPWQGSLQQQLLIL